MTPAEHRDLTAARALHGWAVIEYRPAGEIAGFALVCGTEFHCQLFDGSGFNRKAMREFLREPFEKHGHLTTRVPVGDKANERFNRLFGFERTWSDEQYHYFVMAKLPFGEKTQCQLSQ